jgi:hypothetical protein
MNPPGRNRPAHQSETAWTDLTQITSGFKNIQSVAGIKKTHGTRLVPDFLRFLGLFRNQVPAFLSKNGPKWANLISNPQFSYVFRKNPVPYFLMPVLLNARN